MILQDARADLVAAILRHAKEEQEYAPIPQMFVARTTHCNQPNPVLYEPALVVVAQGTKRVSFGEQEVTYDPTRYLLNSVALPILGHVVEASKAKPYLSVRVPLQPEVIGPCFGARRSAQNEGRRRGSRCGR